MPTDANEQPHLLSCPEGSVSATEAVLKCAQLLVVTTDQENAFETVYKSWQEVYID